MSIDIPTATLRDLVQHPDELQREIIIAMYQAEELAGGKAREMLKMSVRAWHELLQTRGLRPPYDVQDLRDDVRTLKEMGRW